MQLNFPVNAIEDVVYQIIPTLVTNPLVVAVVVYDCKLSLSSLLEKEGRSCFWL